MDPQHLALLIAAGFGAGVCNAIAGGGSLLTFPALLAIGLPPVPATVTNAVAVWPGYIGNAVALRSHLTGFRALAPRLAATAAVGAVGGTVALLAAPPEVFTALVPYLILSATALFALQPLITRRLAAHGGTSAPLLYAGVFIGGVYGAYFNGGMGIVFLTALALGIDAAIGRLNGLKALLALTTGTAAMLSVSLFGPVDWLAVLVLAPACLLGGFTGARIADRLRPIVFRVVVIAFGTAAGGAMLLT
ncbi:sulfite exporter TauE/SafE family protein [Glycomyces sp. NPDC047369]